MTLSLIVSPALTLLTTEEVKDFYTITHHDYDSHLVRMIEFSTDAIETMTNKACITRRYLYRADGFTQAGRKLPLPRTPVQTVIAFRRVQKQGNPIDYPNTAYIITGDGIASQDGTGFVQPFVTAQGIEIIYEAGYGNNSADTPASLRLAVLHHMGYALEKSSADTNMMIQKLTEPFMIKRL